MTKSSRSPTSLGWRFYKMMMLMILLRTMTKSSRSRTSLGSSFYQQFASPQILPYQMTLFQPHLDLDYMWSRSLLLAGRSVWSLSRSSLFFPCLLLCRWKGERRVTGQVEIIQRGRRRCHHHHHHNHHHQYHHEFWHIHQNIWSGMKQVTTAEHQHMTAARKASSIRICMKMCMIFCMIVCVKNAWYVICAII